MFIIQSVTVYDGRGKVILEKTAASAAELQSDVQQQLSPQLDLDVDAGYSISQQRAGFYSSFVDKWDLGTY